MKRKRLRIFLSDSSVETIFSRTYDPNKLGDESNAGWWNYTGYCICDDTGCIALVNPTLHRKLLIETIDA